MEARYSIVNNRSTIAEYKKSIYFFYVDHFCRPAPVIGCSQNVVNLIMKKTKEDPVIRERMPLDTPQIDYMPWKFY